MAGFDHYIPQHLSFASQNINSEQCKNSSQSAPTWELLGKDYRLPMWGTFSYTQAELGQEVEKKQLDTAF